MPGDTVWFGGYLTGFTNPSQFNSNLSVDLFSDSGTLIQHGLFPVIQSLSAGQIALPDSLLSGNYWLRAYAGNQDFPDSLKYFFVPLVINTGNSNSANTYSKKLAKPKQLSALPRVVLVDTVSNTAEGYHSWHIHINDSIHYVSSISITDADKTPAAPLSIINDGIVEGRPLTIKPIDSASLFFKGAASTNTGCPLINQEMVIMVSKDSSFKTLLVRTDSMGGFTLQHLFFYDSAKLYFQVNHIRDTAVTHIRLTFEHNFPPAFQRPMGWSKMEDTIQLAILSDINERNQPSEAHELRPVIVESKKSFRKEMDDKYTRGMFSEPTLYAYDVRHEKAEWDIGELLRRYVPNVDYFMRNNPPTYKGLPIIFYVDEQLKSWDELLAYRFVDFAYVKVFTGMWFGVTPLLLSKAGLTELTLKPVGGGLSTPVSIDPLVVCIYTKREDDLPVIPGLSSVTVGGYSTIRRWHSTAHDRTTLYWEPLQEGNDFTIRFKNNGATKRYRLVIEGMNTTGHLLHFEKVIE